MPKITELDEKPSTSAFQSPAMLGALQNGLNSLVGMRSDYIASLPENVKRRVMALKNLHDNDAAIEKEFRDEFQALKKKYLDLHSPLYQKRAQIIKGTYEPTDTEAIREDDSDEEPEEPQEPKEQSTVEMKGIPEFWLTLLKNHPDFMEMITEKDEPVLAKLIDIELSYLPENHGFKLVFCFDDNDYFTNKTLTKTYVLTNNADSEYDDVVFEKAQGTKIDWKDGKNLTVTIESVTQRHKGTKKTRVVKKEVPAESFFMFFSPPSLPENQEDLEESEFHELQQQVEMDFELGEIIKDKLIPNAVNWFTGKALEFEEFMEDGDEDEIYDSEDEDDEEEESDDDDEADGTAPPQNPPECKQQ